jgi:imidazolonepropionase-like amidohydrolase
MMRARPLSALLLVLGACAAEPPPVASPTAEPAPPPATALPPPVAAPVTIKRVVTLQGRPSGSDVATRAADGTVTIAFDILENGRGPHVDATLKIAADGTLDAFDAKGHHTFGAGIEETFARDASREPSARWKSHEESGATTPPAHAFFVPIAPVPDAVGLLAAALLQNGGTLPLLPAGEARIEKIGDQTLTHGADQRHVVGYAIHGLDLVPSYTWMNDDGTWFGSVDAWSSIVPEGFADVVKPLVAMQEAADKRRDVEVAQKLAHRPPPAGLALTHARVLDVAHGKWLADQTIVVVGDRIQAVGPAKTTKVPPGAEVTDLAGRAVIPGLWDMHAHLGTPDGALDIASGVTTVRDVGNEPDKLDDFKARFDAGAAVGPHVYRMGFVEGRGEKAASSRITAETPDEARAAVAFYAARGYDGMKIYNSVKRELIPIITKEAHAHGMTVTGHIPVHVLAHEAVELGYDGIEHVNMLFLNFFATHDTDTRDTTRFTLVGEKAATLDLASKPVQDFLKVLRAHHTVVDPTVDAFEDLLVGKQGRVTPGLEPMAARLPVQVARSFLTGGLPREGKDELYERSYERVLAMVKALADAKVAVVVGTDSLAGLMMHHELALYVRGGVKPADALRMATLDAARAMKKDKESGSVERGKVADLVILDGDPVAHIADLGKVVSTVKSGVVYASTPLYATVGVRPAP